MGIKLTNLKHKDHVFSLISKALRDRDRFERYEAIRNLDPKMLKDNSYESIMLDIAKNDISRVNCIEAFYMLIKHLGGIKGSARELAEKLTEYENIKNISLEDFKKKLMLKRISRVTGEVNLWEK